MSIREAESSFLSRREGVLWIGFAGLILLMALIAIDATTSLRDVEVTTAALRTESRQRDALLDDLRADIYRSATVVRDYLLERDDARAESQKQEMTLLRARIDETLRVYEQKVPPTERDAFKDLRNRVESYWESLVPALRWNAAMRRTEAGSFVQIVILPFRADVVQLTRQVTALNERDLDAGEEHIRAVQSRLRVRVAAISSVALVLGVLLGAVSIRRVQRLERDTRARYQEVEEARRELLKLSDRLVTAQEDERRRLSRELHDEVGQTMSAMLVELGRAETAVDGRTRTERIASVRRMAEDTVGVVRNMALLLRPSMLDDLGLIAALKWQAREVTRRSGLKVKMIADDIAEDLPDSHRTCLYRVVQEALNNCAKHSQATHVRVAVQRNLDGLTVTVQDDGVGFEPKQEKGMGLLGMEERVARLGGLFAIASQPGSGTLLSFYFPLAGDGQAFRKDVA